MTVKMGIFQGETKTRGGDLRAASPGSFALLWCGGYAGAPSTMASSSSRLEKGRGAALG